MKRSSNLSCSSSCHWTVSGAGHRMSTRSATIRSRSSLMQQPRHDRLSGAGVVGEHEPQPRLRQHVLVDRDDLVGQPADARERDGEVRVVGVGQLDPPRLDESNSSPPSTRRPPSSTRSTIPPVNSSRSRTVSRSVPSLVRTRRLTALPRSSIPSSVTGPWKCPAIVTRWPVSASSAAASMVGVGHMFGGDRWRRVDRRDAACRVPGQAPGSVPPPLLGGIVACALFSVPPGHGARGWFPLESWMRTPDRFMIVQSCAARRRAVQRHHGGRTVLSAASALPGHRLSQLPKPRCERHASAGSLATRVGASQRASTPVPLGLLALPLAPRRFHAVQW